MKQILGVIITICLSLLIMVPVAAYTAEGAENKDFILSDTEKVKKVVTGSSVSGTFIKGEEKTEVDSFTENRAEVRNQTMDKKMGILKIQNAAAGTGEKLTGAIFTVYENGKKIEEIVVKDGNVSLSLPEGSYNLKEKKAAPGYGIEAACICFTITAEEITLVEVTSVIDLENTNPQELIPKTGEILPVGIYILSSFCFLIVALCGFTLLDRKKK